MTRYVDAGMRLAAVLTVLFAAVVISANTAFSAGGGMGQMMGGGHGGGQGGGGGHGGGGHGGGGHGGGGRGGGGGGHGGAALPGAVTPMCRGAGGAHAPHYCEPGYKVVSSARGIAVQHVAPAGERVLRVSLKELNVQAPGVEQSLVVAGGTGDLAGAVRVPGGWKGNIQVLLPLTGTGTVYDTGGASVHLFPLTGE